MKRNILFLITTAFVFALSAGVLFGLNQRALAQDPTATPGTPTVPAVTPVDPTPEEPPVTPEATVMTPEATPVTPTITPDATPLTPVCDPGDTCRDSPHTISYACGASASRAYNHYPHHRRCKDHHCFWRWKYCSSP
jgi:hypothetical protein